MQTNDPTHGRSNPIVRILCVFFLLMPLGYVCAQGRTEREATDLPIPPPSSVPGGIAVEQSPLDAIVFIDPDGRRLAYLPGNWPLELMDDFCNYLLQDQRDPVPSYVLQEVIATGKVVDDRVEAVVRLTVTTMNGRVVRVPIGFKEGVLPPLHVRDDAAAPSDRLRYRGPGSAKLIVDPQDGQYVVVIRSDRAQPETPELSEVEESQPEESSESNEEASVDSTSTSKEKPLDTSPERFDSSVVFFGMKSDSGRKNVAQEHQHHITLSFWFPLRRVGGENRLSVSFPQSISSQFTMTVPLKEAEATLSQGAMLDSQTVADREETRFKITGLKPNFDFSWREKQEERIDDRPVITVKEALIQVRLENKSTIYDATLPVSSPTGGGFDRLRVRLPRGTRLDRDSMEKFASAGNFSFRELVENPESREKAPNDESEAQATGTTSNPIVEISFMKKEVGTIPLQLKAVRPLLPSETGGEREIEGFEILDAERQHGYLSVRFPSDMRASWRPIEGLRRIDAVGSGPTDTAEARFEFFSQPFQLSGRIVSPQTRINVRPEYQLRINKSSLALTARFSYTIRGSKAEKLVIHLPGGWQWNGEITPTNVVDSAGVDQDEQGVMTIPLRAASDGVFDIEFKAFQPIAFDENDRFHLVANLPRPEADWCEPAPVVVVPADNVEVVPIDADSVESADPLGEGTAKNPSEKSDSQKQRTRGLARRVRRSLSPRIEIPVRQQDPLTYRTESSEAVFVADLLYHRQRITTMIHTDVRLLDTEDQVVQVISYDVAYEPIDRLFFWIPKNLDESNRVRVSIGGKSLDLRDVVPASDEVVPEHWVKKRISFSEAMIGKFQLTIRYSIPPIVPEPNFSMPISIPLVRPFEAAATDHYLGIGVPPWVLVRLHDEAAHSWKSADSGTPSATRGAAGMAFHATQNPGSISLLVTLADRDALGSTVIERAWLDTWLTGKIRRDRGTYLITSDRESVTLRLPEDTDGEKVVVYRDEVQIPATMNASRELVIPLGGDVPGRSTRLEVLYQMPFEFSSSLVDLELPFFESDPLVRCEYWQIILPQSRHVLGVPEGWTPEYQWKWKGLFWGRIPSLDKKKVGLQGEATDFSTASAEANYYLFSTLNPVSVTSLYIANRAVIVFVSSSLALVVGLALIYFPRTRYIGSLFGLGLAFLATVLYRPTPVLLMLQASVLGIFLALTAAYIYRIVHRDEKWIVPTIPDNGDRSQPSEVYSVIMDETGVTAKPKSSKSNRPQEPE